MGARLDGKVAVITGGASGMGRATALRFLAEGASVVIGDLNQETGKATLSEIEERGAAERAIFMATDVAEEADIEALVNGAITNFGKLDCVFNNAGIGGAIGPISQTKVEEWDYTFNVLVRSVFLGIKHGVIAINKIDMVDDPDWLDMVEQDIRELKHSQIITIYIL